MAPEEATYLVRGTVPDDPDEQRTAVAEATARPEVVGVFADPVISTCLVCPGDPAVGSDQDVADLLGVKALADAGLDGYRVPVAIVDTGVNLAHLESKGRDPKFPAAQLDPGGGGDQAGPAPGRPRHHVRLRRRHRRPQGDPARPRPAAVGDPGETAMSGLLSDAVLSYSRLLGIIQALPASRRSLVVNKLGDVLPTWDFPVGHPGNYSDNPAHPFNVIVASLESAGADILFAAGNCGRDCPDGRCRFGASRPICGANSHPSVLSVAGVDTRKRRVGYSSQGPGRLDADKPDLSAYTHFRGSGCTGRRRHLGRLPGRGRGGGGRPREVPVVGAVPGRAAGAAVQDGRGPGRDRLRPRLRLGRDRRHRPGRRPPRAKRASRRRSASSRR